MSILVELPSALLPYAGGSSQVELEAPGRTVGDALAALSGRHPGVVDRVLDERGAVRQHVNVFVDGDDIRYLGGLHAPVADGATVVIVPAVSGG
jgi:sulfur-carrier protein